MKLACEVNLHKKIEACITNVVQDSFPDISTSRLCKISSIFYNVI